MSATLAAATSVTRAGVIVSGTFVAASLDDQFANNGKQYLVINNAAVGAVTLTLVTPSDASGRPVDSVGALTVQDPIVTIAPSVTRIIGPFKPSVWNNASGYVNYTLSSLTTVTVKVLLMDNYSPTA